MTSGKPAHRVGMHTTGGGCKSVQVVVITVRKHCELSFVTGEWLKSMIRDESVVAEAVGLYVRVGVGISQ